VALFGLGVLLDAPYLKRHWLDFGLRVLFAAALPLILRFGLRRGAGHFWAYYAQQGMFWFPLLFCAYARTRRDERLLRALKVVLLVCLVVTTLTTIGWLIQGMLRGGRVYAYARSLGSGEPGFEAYFKELMLRNIGGYDFVYATTLSLPLSCYAAIQSRGWKRAGFILLCAGQLAMVALSQYNYATLFSAAIVGLELVAACLRLLFKKITGRPLSMALSLGLAAIPFVLLYLLRVPLVTWVASVAKDIGFSNTAYSFQQLLSALTGGAVDSASRLEYYRLPIQGFLRSPWLGSLAGHPPLLSQHSEILDLLSAVGLVGAAAVAFMIAWVGRGSLGGVKSHDAAPHLALQGMALLACALLGTVTFSRDIPLVLCAGALLALEGRGKVVRQ
jgi:hypothetical protein